MQGQPQSVRYLGLTLIEGELVDQRPVLGAAWLALASKLDSRYEDERLQQALDQLDNEERKRMVEFAQKIGRNPGEYAPKIVPHSAVEAAGGKGDGGQ